MSYIKFFIFLFSIFAFASLLFCLTTEIQKEEEVVIPQEAHQKAIEALKALGPERGAKHIDSRMVKILGVVKGVESVSEKIKSALQNLGAKETETGYQIDLPGDVLFDFDKWEIRPDAEKTLKKVGEIIADYGSPEVIISGHTDLKGSDEYNQKLSEKRAVSVKEWFEINAGIKSEIMQTVGYGERKPVAPNANPDGSDNPEGRQKNRRVEILIKKK